MTGEERDCLVGEVISTIEQLEDMKRGLVSEAEYLRYGLSDVI